MADSVSVETMLQLARAALPLEMELFAADGSDLHLPCPDRRLRVTRFTVTEINTGEVIEIEGDTWFQSKRGVWRPVVLEIEKRHRGPRVRHTYTVQIDGDADRFASSEAQIERALWESMDRGSVTTVHSVTHERTEDVR